MSRRIDRLENTTDQPFHRLPAQLPSNWYRRPFGREKLGQTTANVGTSGVQNQQKGYFLNLRSTRTTHWTNPTRPRVLSHEFLRLYNSKKIRAHAMQWRRWDKRRVYFNQTNWLAAMKNSLLRNKGSEITSVMHEDLWYGWEDANEQTDGSERVIKDYFSLLMDFCGKQLKTKLLGIIRCWIGLIKPAGLR